MTITVAHAFTSAKSQGADATVVSKNEWNAGHLITCGTGVLLGRTTAGTGAVEEITPFATDLVVSSGVVGLVQQEFLRVLDSDGTGSDVNTAQPVFPTAGTFTALTTTSYIFDSFLHIARTAGNTSHTTSLLFGGTATFTSLRWMADVANPTGVALGATSAIIASSASAVAITAANTSTTENLFIMWKGFIRVNGAGTIIPQFIYSAAPGGAPVIKANSFFRIKSLGAGTGATTTLGAWA